MYFWLLFSLSCLSTLPVCSANPHDRYNPYRKKTEPSEHTPQKESHASHRQTELPNLADAHEAPEPADILADDDAYLEYKISHEPDTTPHTPLGAICLEIDEYCSYFIEHCMTDDALKSQRQSLTLFCNLLQLLANLADADCGIVRLHHYLLNLSSLSQTLYATSSLDNHIVNHQNDYPFIKKLQQTVRSQDEITFFMQYTLRTPAAGKETVTALFAELQTFAHYKLHAILETFQHDTYTLLHRTQHPEMQSSQDTTILGFERSNIHWLGWLCKHAATTCLDLVQTLPSSPLLAHTSSLMNQIQLMLSTMALTYTHLGTNTVRSQDRNTLASHYAKLITYMEPSAPRRGLTSYLVSTQTLPTLEQKQDYLETIFASEQASTQLLQEFFPAFNDILDHNLSQFCALLTEQVLTILKTRYWMQS